jgi:hypothetical protein
MCIASTSGSSRRCRKWNDRSINPTVVRKVVPKLVLNYVVTQLIRQTETTSVVKKIEVYRRTGD